MQRAASAELIRARKELTMSPVVRSKRTKRSLAMALVPASLLLAVPAAQAHVGVGLSLGVPLVVAPPLVVVAPPPYSYAPPPVYYYAPGYGYFWYDRFGHRHWRH
jgi:hypothetical protein